MEMKDKNNKDSGTLQPREAEMATNIYTGHWLDLPASGHGRSLSCYVMACLVAPTRPRLRDTWHMGEEMGPKKVHNNNPTRRLEQKRRGPWTSGRVHLERYIWEGTCGWDWGWGMGKEPSYPTRPLPISELPPRHQAVALPSQNRVSQQSSSPDGCRKEGTWVGRAGPGGQSVRVSRQESASFCKWHGGLSSVCGPWARLKTSLSSCNPRAKICHKYLLSTDVVGSLPC